MFLSCILQGLQIARFVFFISAKNNYCNYYLFALVFKGQVPFGGRNVQRIFEFGA